MPSIDGSSNRCGSASRRANPQQSRTDRRAWPSARDQSERGEPAVHRENGGVTRRVAIETIGSYFMVFNTLLNYDNLNAGRKLDAK